MSPRHRGTIPEPERTRLISAIQALDEAATELQNAVKAARDADGSVREIANLIGKSPTTIQSWSQERIRAT